VNRPRVFLSYAGSDSQAAARLVRHLQDEGVDVVTTKDVSPGQSFASFVIDRIESADAVLVLVSPESERSEWVQAETSLALANAIRDSSTLVVPVIVDKRTAVPSPLEHIQPLDLSNPETSAYELDRFVEQIARRGAAGEGERQHAAAQVARDALRFASHSS
jgi:TIR domain